MCSAVFSKWTEYLWSQFLACIFKGNERRVWNLFECVYLTVSRNSGEREREAGWIGRRKLHYFFYHFSNSLSLRGMLIEMPLWNPSLKNTCSISAASVWRRSYNSTITIYWFPRSAQHVLGKFCPKHVELILEINNFFIVSSRWFSILLHLHWWCRVKHKSSYNSFHIQKILTSLASNSGDSHLIIDRGSKSCSEARNVTGC